MVETFEDSLNVVFTKTVTGLPDILLQCLCDAIRYSKNNFERYEIIGKSLLNFVLSHLASHNTALTNELGKRLANLFGSQKLVLCLEMQPVKFLNQSIQFIIHGFMLI